MHSPAPHQELELKLELPPASLAELTKSRLLRRLKAAPRHPTEVSRPYNT